MLMDEDVVVAGGQAVERVGGWVGGWVDRMASGDMRNRVRGLPHFLRHGMGGRRHTGRFVYMVMGLN